MANNNGKPQLNSRPPIVTIMGHVDHGKTSILDALRKTNVQAGEYGGITQHIGAHQIVHKSQKITFIDTPGHAAFSSMRSRGGKAADIIILVVAADDGVMTQTKEAIVHAKASGAKIIVAINKMDVKGADSTRVKKQLSESEILVEDWGGDVIAVEVSAKTRLGLDVLLDTILLVAEMLELKADPKGELEGIIIEAKMDKKKGPLVSCIIKNGTLSVSDKIMGSGYTAKVKALLDTSGVSVKEVLPGNPAEILGFRDVPNVGDLIVAEGSELGELAIDESRVEIVGKDAKKTISVILKADTQGTLEAVKSSLADLVTSSVGLSFAIKFLQCSTGPVTESDILLAQGTKGIIIGFNIILPTAISDFARSQNVTVTVYKTIYELTSDAKDLLEGKADFEEKKIKGRAQVLKLFKLPSGDMIAGCKVLAGALKPEVKVWVYSKNPADLTKDDIPLYKGVIQKLKTQKDDVKVVGKDNECGVLLKPFYPELAKDMYLEVM